MVTGGFAYKNLFISQHNDAPMVFKQFLEIVKPTRIIEMGTFHGGLTLLLRDLLDELDLINSLIKSYDIYDFKFIDPFIQDRNVEICIKNLFNATYSNFIDNNAKQEIYNFIQQDGVSLVLCDGGCKKCEFNLISPLLKTNDIIMAHDYAPNNEYFEQFIKDKEWDWMEIQDSDIENSILTNNLDSYLEDLTRSILWCCKIKSQ